MERVISDERLDFASMVVGVKVILLNISCAVYGHIAEDSLHAKLYWEYVGAKRLRELNEMIDSLQEKSKMEPSLARELAESLRKYEKMVNKSFKASRKERVKTGSVMAKLRRMHSDIIFQLGEVVELGELERMIS